jgi:hypothetical protein
MRLRTALVLAAAAAGLVAMTASPAGAADTTATFTLTGGTLSLSVQPTAALIDAATGTTTVTGTLGTVSVIDLRGQESVWAATAASTAFACGPDELSSTSVQYGAGAVTGTGSIALPPSGIVIIDSVRPVVVPTSLSGNNTASWIPTLHVTMPAGALADTYTGIVTTSVA